ncbi:hypothetical protein HYH03_005426 [Edaphochlamys debaryana]|uniref:Uncharacterized protein n=1 Tax=Edaphochlamys debaryana TaxID=47281 RepID=A0A835Y5N4_9CHLO|nr:hypothetical protein HYH03_005426 [Edaphochlamys debaryana]|eukprot:KAG2496605.1 hypothetical protein HYH03_005426 [Edaphochlamys debaryana]
MRGRSPAAASAAAAAHARAAPGCGGGGDAAPGQEADDPPLKAADVAIASALGAAAASGGGLRGALAREAGFWRWWALQGAGVDLLSWLLALAMCVVTLNRGAAFMAGCPASVPAVAATTPEGGWGDGGGECPGCSPCWARCGALLGSFPCGLGELRQYLFTCRNLPSNVLLALARRDFSVLAYTASLLGALGVLLLRPAAYVRWRHVLVAGVRGAMMAGNLAAAAWTPRECVGATTALYYLPAYRAATGARLNPGFAYFATANLVLERVPLSLHLPLSLLEWGMALGTALLGTRRTLGPAAAAPLLAPSWLLAHAALYWVLPLLITARLETGQRRRFRHYLAASAGRVNPWHLAPPAAPTTPRSRAPASPVSAFASSRPTSAFASAATTPRSSPQLSAPTPPPLPPPPAVPKLASTTPPTAPPPAAAAKAEPPPPSVFAAKATPHRAATFHHPIKASAQPSKFAEAADNEPYTGGIGGGGGLPSLLTARSLTADMECYAPPAPEPCANDHDTTKPPTAAAAATAAGGTSAAPAVPAGDGTEAHLSSTCKVPTGLPEEAAAVPPPMPAPVPGLVPLPVPQSPPPPPPNMVAAAAGRPAAPAVLRGTLVARPALGSGPMLTGAGRMPLPYVSGAAASRTEYSSPALSYRALTSTRVVSYKARTHPGVPFPAAAAQVSGAFRAATAAAAAAAAWPQLRRSGDGRMSPVSISAGPGGRGPASDTSETSDTASAFVSGSIQDDSDGAGGAVLTGAARMLRPPPGQPLRLATVAEAPPPPFLLPPPYMSVARHVVVEGCVHLLGVITTLAVGSWDEQSAKAGGFTVNELPVALHAELLLARGLLPGPGGSAAAEGVAPAAAVRVVAAGPCGGVVLDELVEVPGGTGREEGEEDESCVEVRVRLPAPRQPGTLYLHLLPPPSPPLTADLLCCAAHRRPDSRPLASLPLLCLPSAASAAELCGLYGSMLCELRRAWLLEGPEGLLEGGDARAAAFQHHFLPFAQDLGHLMACSLAASGGAASTSTGSNAALAALAASVLGFAEAMGLDSLVTDIQRLTSSSLTAGGRSNCHDAMALSQGGAAPPALAAAALPSPPLTPPQPRPEPRPHSRTHRRASFGGPFPPMPPKDLAADGAPADFGAALQFRPSRTAHRRASFGAAPAPAATAAAAPGEATKGASNGSKHRRPSDPVIVHAAAAPAPVARVAASAVEPALPPTPHAPIPAADEGDVDRLVPEPLLQPQPAVGPVVGPAAGPMVEEGLAFRPFSALEVAAVLAVLAAAHGGRLAAALAAAAAVVAALACACGGGGDVKLMAAVRRWGQRACCMSAWAAGGGYG